MIFRTLLEGLILGFSTGTICLVTCTPIYLPYLLTEERKLIKSLLTVGEISLGRFFSYLAFGALAGFAGAKISSINRELFTSIAYILLSIYLILSAVRTRQKSKKCHIPKITKFTKRAFLLGVLTGINFCPAFLIALSKAVNLGGAISGMLLFLGFFFGTTVFLIPLAFVGLLSKIKEMKIIAQLASVLIGIWFIFTGIKGIVHWNEHNAPIPEDARIVDVFHPDRKILVISNLQNDEYFRSLKDSISVHHRNEVSYFLVREDNFNFLEPADSSTIILDISLLEKKSLQSILKERDYFAVEENYSIQKVVNFLRTYTFRTAEYVHWEFREEK